jgi:hypothetical protein
MPSLVLDNDINLYIEKHPMFFEDKAGKFNSNDNNKNKIKFLKLKKHLINLFF